MNKFIHTIHKNQVIIYKKYNNYYVIDNDVYILICLFKFKCCYKNNRKVIFIDNNYINYILKKLKEYNVSYVVINENYGYDRISEYNNLNNKYLFYYRKGKKWFKNNKKMDYIINCLKSKRDINVLSRIEMILNEY